MLGSALQDEGIGSAFHRLRNVFAETVMLVPGLTERRRRIAQAMLMRANEDIHALRGELVSWIGVTSLKEALAYDRRTVQRSIAWLVESGLLEIDRKGGGRARSTHYRFSKAWLKTAALSLENSGIGAAYGLGPKFYDTINSVTDAAHSPVRQTGAPASGREKGGLPVQNRGADAAVTPHCAPGAPVNSGAAAADSKGHAADMSVTRAPDGAETASISNGKGGKAARNSGAAVPPETVINNPNISGRARTTAGPRKLTPRLHDPRQGYFHHVVPGGRKADARPGPQAQADMPNPEQRNPHWQTALLPRAEEILGDTARAMTALRWLGDTQKQRLAQGLRPNDEQLARWLYWALQAAERPDSSSDGTEDAVGPPALGAGAPVVAPPSSLAAAEHEIRLARVERMAAGTAAAVEAMSQSVAELVAALRPVLATGAKSAA